MGMTEPAARSERQPQSAYLHIPFCRRRCFYCDFPVSVVGDKRHGGNSLAIARYVDAIGREIRLVGQVQQSVQNEQQQNTPGRDELQFVRAMPRKNPKLKPGLKTVFFGGGTPSLLTAEQLGKILSVLRQQIGIAEGAEISIEMDPGTFDLAQVQGYLSVGVNRISLGSQAFQPRLLETCGRTHGVKEIYEAVDLLRQAEVQNFSLDLISGLPTQTLGDWQESLEKVIAIAPTHVSAYDMVLEPNTVFGKRYEPGDQPLPADETAAEMYRLAQAMLTAAGYEHYEVSNYARPGFQCQHNRVYWEMQPYYAFGMGAASFVDRARFTRPRTQQSYYDWLAEAEAKVELGQSVEGVFGDRLEPIDEVLETLMVGMRLVQGVSLAQLEQQFGDEVVVSIEKTIAPFLRKSWVEIVDQRIRFTDPEGFLFSNQVLAELFDALESLELPAAESQPLSL